MRQHKISLGWFLGLTLAAVLISIPLGPTLSKYVWNENVGSIDLTVTPYYHEPEDTYSLTHMSASPTQTYGTWTPGQSSFSVYLTADEGYLLPSMVYVKIDGTRHTVPDGGISGIWYDAVDGYLSIDGDLLWGNPSHITISAAAEQILLPEPPVQQEPVQQEPAQQEPIQQEPAQQEPIQQEPAQQEPIQQEPIQQEPVQQEPAQQEPAQQEPAQQGQEPEL